MDDSRGRSVQGPSQAQGSKDATAVGDVIRERDILIEAQDLVKIGAWEWEIDVDPLWWSNEVYRIFGHWPSEFTPTFDAFLEQVHPDDRVELLSHVEAALAGTVEHDVRHRVVWPDGQVRYVHERGKVTRDADGRPVAMLGTVMDVTEETLLQQERDDALLSLAESEERYRLLAENAWDVIWTMDLDGTVTYVSPSVERVRGLTPAEAAAQTPEQMQPPESIAKGAEYWGRLFSAIAAGTEPPTFHGEEDYYRKDGSIMHGELDVIPQVDANGKVLRILGVTRDISERKRLEAELRRLAVTDPLTGVCNRRRADELLTSAINDARRYHYPLSLMMLDIDHFKDVNDEYGHHIGDDVLVELTSRLRGQLRGTDVLARWGGEEFVVLSGRCTHAEAVLVAEKLRSVIADSPFGHVGTITISIGIAELHPADDLRSWMRRADKTMYEAKTAGRNTIKVDA